MEGSARVLGRSVVVPITNPESADRLIRAAALLAAPDGGTVVPVTVVTGAEHADDEEAARQLVLHCEEVAVAAGAQSRGLVVPNSSVALAVLEAMDEVDASLVVMGWTGRSTRSTVFGELIDSVAGRSPVPLVVVRLRHDQPRRLVVGISTDDLTPAGLDGVDLAVDVTTRMRDGWSVPVQVICAGLSEDGAALPAGVVGLVDRVHRDPRRLDRAVGSATTGDELVVVPVPPTESGLRTATTHVAWAAPESSLAILLHTGPPGAGRAAEAVSGAGQPAPVSEPQPEAPHDVRVTLRLGDPDEDAPARLSELLGTIGERRDVDSAGRRLVVARVTVHAESSGSALGRVMTALHDAEWLRGADIRYDIDEPRDT